MLQICFSTNPRLPSKILFNYSAKLYIPKSTIQIIPATHGARWVVSKGTAYDNPFCLTTTKFVGHGDSNNSLHKSVVQLPVPWNTGKTLDSPTHALIALGRQFGHPIYNTVSSEGESCNHTSRQGLISPSAP